MDGRLASCIHMEKAVLSGCWLFSIGGQLIEAVTLIVVV